MKSRFDDHDFWGDWRASHDPIEGRLTFRQVMVALAVLALIGVHWVPVAAWFDGVDGRTVGEAVLEMWGLALVVVVGGCVLALTVVALGALIGRVMEEIANATGVWPAEDSADMAVDETREKEDRR